MQILIISIIDQHTIEVLSNKHDVICKYNHSKETLKSLIQTIDVLIFRSGVEISSEILNHAHKLKLVIRAGSGMDNIDLLKLKEKGIVFKRIQKPSAIAVSELCLSLMMALARNIIRADHLTKKGDWPKYELQGSILKGKTLGIIGSGNIGTYMGQLGSMIGMNVIGCVATPDETAKMRLAKNKIRLTDFDEINETADFLCLFVPLNKATRYMINHHTMSKMKKGSFLLNLARGGIVDEVALYDMLNKKDRLRGAALDVHENEGSGNISPLASMPNVILTPHIGSQTVDTQQEIGREIIHFIDLFKRTLK